MFSELVSFSILYNPSQEKLNLIYFQVYYLPMETHGKKWGVLLWPHLETLEWGKGWVKTKLLKNVTTWLRNLKNLMVTLPFLNNCRGFLQHLLLYHSRSNVVYQCLCYFLWDMNELSKRNGSVSLLNSNDT